MDIKEIVLEYLVLVKQEDTFCTSEEAFLKFLDVDSSLQVLVKAKTISILPAKKNGAKFTVAFILRSGLVAGKDERYFKLTLISKESGKLSQFDLLSALLEKNFVRLHADVSINILWNDIARQYALEGYSLINQVENLLRRLIANFMLVNVGLDWHKSHIPEEVESRDQNLKSNYSDYLHQTYFSDLKTILFGGQRDLGLRNIGEIQLLVERHISAGKDKIEIAELQGVVAKSLWEKYFSNHNSYYKKDLEEDLDKLNKLRNEIAHNRHVGRETLGKIQNLTTKIIKTLKLELERLPETILTEKEMTFYSQNESMRLAKTNARNLSRLAEHLIMDWYIEKYGAGSTMLINFGPYDRGTDLFVQSEGIKIGVQIKAMPLSRLMQLRNEISHGQVPKILQFGDIPNFDEYHMAIVISDFIAGNEMHIVNTFTGLLKQDFPNLMFIIGFMNENRKFQLLHAPN